MLRRRSTGISVRTPFCQSVEFSSRKTNASGPSVPGLAGGRLLRSSGLSSPSFFSGSLSLTGTSQLRRLIPSVNSQVLSFCSFPLASTRTRPPAGASLSATTAPLSAASRPALQTAAHFVQDFIAGLPLGAGDEPLSCIVRTPLAKIKEKLPFWRAGGVNPPVHERGRAHNRGVHTPRSPTPRAIAATGGWWQWPRRSRVRP